MEEYRKKAVQPFNDGDRYQLPMQIKRIAVFPLCATTLAPVRVPENAVKVCHSGVGNTGRGEVVSEMHPSMWRDWNREVGNA